MAHGWKFDTKGYMTPALRALALAQRDAEMAAHGDVIDPHDDLLFEAIYQSLLVLTTALSPGGDATDIDTSVRSGCVDEGHLVPYIHLSVRYIHSGTTTDMHSWSTHVDGVFDVTNKEKARSLMTANLAAMGRTVGTEDTTIFEALSTATTSFLSTFAPTTQRAQTRMSVSVTDGSLERVTVSLGIDISEEEPTPPGPLTGVITPPAITSQQNDYNPTGLSGAHVLRLSSVGAQNITGLAGGLGIRQIYLYNVGLTVVSLRANHVSSVAANRFLFSANINVGANDGVHLIYDPVANGWRVIGKSV